MGEKQKKRERKRNGGCLVGLELDWVITVENPDGGDLNFGAFSRSLYAPRKSASRRIHRMRVIARCKFATYGEDKSKG